MGIYFLLVWFLLYNFLDKYGDNIDDMVTIAIALGAEATSLGSLDAIRIGTLSDKPAIVERAISEYPALLKTFLSTKNIGTNTRI